MAETNFWEEQAKIYREKQVVSGMESVSLEDVKKKGKDIPATNLPKKDIEFTWQAPKTNSSITPEQ